MNGKKTKSTIVLLVSPFITFDNARSNFTRRLIMFSVVWALNLKLKIFLFFEHYAPKFHKS